MTPEVDASVGSPPDATDTAIQRAIVFSGALDSQTAPDLYWMTEDGTRFVRLTDTPEAELFPSWSPDRTRVAFVRDSALYVLEVDSLEVRLVAPHVGRERSDSTHELSAAAWSPDGTQLLYPYQRMPFLVGEGVDRIDQSYDTTLHYVNADGTNELGYNEPPEGSQPPGLGSLGQPAWSSTGLIAFTVADNCPDCAGGSRYAYDRSEGGSYKEITPLDLAEYPLYPRNGLDWSPDATHWAFVAKADPTSESPGVIAVRPVDKAEEIRELTATGAWNPRYSPDGASIAYLASDGIYVMTADGRNQHRVMGANFVRGLDW